MTATTMATAKKKRNEKSMRAIFRHLFWSNWLLFACWQAYKPIQFISFVANKRIHLNARNMMIFPSIVQSSLGFRFGFFFFRSQCVDWAKNHIGNGLKFHYQTNNLTSKEICLGISGIHFLWPLQNSGIISI